MPVIVDDLFAGAGGWDLAAAQYGLHARGVEIAPHARTTREVNGLTTVHDDAWTYEPDDEAEGMVASPPCQTFSLAGKGHGRAALDLVQDALAAGAWKSRDLLWDLGQRVGDERTALVLLPLHYAMTHPYRWLAWEQVLGALPAWEACAEVLRDHGWSVWTGTVTAEMYGVPQTRRRALLLASQDHEVSPPVPTCSRYYPRKPDTLDPGVQPWVSMAEGLGWGFPRPSHLGDVTSRRGTIRPLEHPAFTFTTRMGNGNFRWLDLPPGPVPPVRHPDREAWRERVRTEVLPRVNNQSGTTFDLAWPADRPSPTVAGRPLIAMPGENANRFNSSTKSRNDGLRVTVQDVATLQTFPSTFTWEGPQRQRFTQVGNAIPPVLAAAALEVVAPTPPR